MNQNRPDGAAREGRIARSWRLSKIALGIIRSDPAMMGLAAISVLFAAAALAVVYDATGVFSLHRHRDAGQLALISAALAFPLTFVSVFFNTAIAAAAAGVLEGRRPTLREALAVPASRLGEVALWSLLSSLVGVLIEQIASRLPLLGSIAVRLFGLSWSLASMFAVPILATEGCSAPSCLKRSASLVKKRWGEGIAGNVIITAWTVLAMLPLGIVFGVGLAATRHSSARVAVIAIWVVALVLITALAGVIRQTFAVVLYRYAVTGHAAGGFAESDLQAPFGRAGGLLGARAGGKEQPRARRAWWPWLLSALAGCVAVLVWELTKRHYSAHHLSGRILSAVMFAVLLAALVRAVIRLAARMRSR